MRSNMIRVGLLIVAIFNPAVLGIEFESNGYKNVIVSIHPDVSETNGQMIIDNIKVSVLHTNYFLA